MILYLHLLGHQLSDSGTSPLWFTGIALAPLTAGVTGSVQWILEWTHDSRDCSWKAEKERREERRERNMSALRKPVPFLPHQYFINNYWWKVTLLAMGSINLHSTYSQLLNYVAHRCASVFQNITLPSRGFTANWDHMTLCVFFRVNIMQVQDVTIRITLFCLHDFTCYSVSNWHLAETHYKAVSHLWNLKDMFSETHTFLKKKNPFVIYIFHFFLWKMPFEILKIDRDLTRAWFAVSWRKSLEHMTAACRMKRDYVTLHVHHREFCFVI